MKSNSFKLLNIQLSLINIDEITDEMVKQRYESKINQYMQMRKSLENKKILSEEENKKAKYERQIQLIEEEMDKITKAYMDIETKEKREEYYKEINTNENEEKQEGIEQIRLKGEKFNKQMREFRNKYNIGDIGKIQKDINPLIIYKGKIGNIEHRKDNER